MKILALLGASLWLITSFNAQAQGELNYRTRVTGSLVERVFAANGDTLQGTGYSAQLFAANGANQEEATLTAVPGSLVHFQTGATLGGTITPLTLAIPQVPVGGTGTFQLRAWDNLDGTVTSWEQTFFSGVATGKSLLFNVSGLTANPNIPPNMIGFQSFYLTPEPGTYALLGLGGMAWLALRSKKAKA